MSRDVAVGRGKELSGGAWDGETDPTGVRRACLAGG